MPEAELPPFLRLPDNIRKNILSYLLCPGPREDFTTINYELEWPKLQNPASLTFADMKLDMCFCSKGGKPSGEHLYTRYACEGPLVHVKAKNSPLWVLETPNGPVNILRPATQTELDQKPGASIARVNKLLYQESTPLLYRGRKLRFLAGHCPRGRYEAYATETILSRMSVFAREQITHLSLICQEYEEDCRWKDARRSYASFCEFVLCELPSCQTLHLLVQPGTPPGILQTFFVLFQREGMRILAQTHVDDEPVECLDAIQFLENCLLAREDRHTNEN